MFGRTSIYNPIIASMCDISHESGNQNIFFITWRIFTFIFGLLCGRFIILCSMSMMSSLVVFILVKFSFAFRTISFKESYFITSITSELIFLVGRVLTFRMMMMMVPSGFLRLNCESLIFNSCLFFLSCYLSFFLWAFFPNSVELG